jgi:hypothetical protein
MPIELTTSVAVITTGSVHSIFLTVVVTNGTSESIELAYCDRLQLVILNMARNGSQIWCIAPKIDMQQSPTLVEVKPGSSFSGSYDLQTWKIDEGWLPGRYEMDIAVSGISGQTSNKGRFNMTLSKSVTSFEIKGPLDFPR